MSVRMYVVLLREHGLFIVAPVEGKSQKDAIEDTLGFKGGYSAGLVDLEIEPDAQEAWAAWVEGTAPDGKPYFMLRGFDASLSEEAVTAKLKEAGEEPLKLNKTPVYRPGMKLQINNVDTLPERAF